MSKTTIKSSNTAKIKQLQISNIYQNKNEFQKFFLYLFFKYSLRSKKISHI